MFLRSLGFALLGLVLVGLPPVQACPFCSTQGQTLSSEVGQADFIVLGTLKNAKRDPDDFTKGSTDLEIVTVVKPHAYLKGKKTIVLPRYVPLDAKAGDGEKFLVFCSLYSPSGDVGIAAIASSTVMADSNRATLDPYRGEQIKGKSDLPEYLQQAIVARDQDATGRLKFFFKYLDHAELVINTDAFTEFGNSEYKDVRKLAETLPPEKLLKWLKDPNTSASRFGLYGLMFGHCGKADDAGAIQALLDDPKNAFSSGLDGLFACYILLKPKEGWDYLKTILSDPKKDFSTRYAALKVLRFFWDERKDVVKQEDLLDAMKMLVGQEEIADLPIEDLRKWGAWDQTGFVLQEAAKPSHNKQIVKRAVLRFALGAAEDGKNVAAAAYVANARKEDAERVKFVEEMLADERPKPPAKK